MTAQAIHTYLRLGWSVLPLKPRDKVPLTAHGVNDASADPDAVAKWWEAWPDANVGVATGDISGIVVLDIDLRHGGFETLDQLVKQHGPLPDTPTVITGGGGLHYYFVGTGIKCRQIAEGIDLKGTGGYVVAPPSVHPSGETYRWMEGRSPDDVPLASLPDWIAQLHQQVTSLSDTEIDIIPVGKRNNCLFDLALYLRRRLYMSPHTIYHILDYVAREFCEQPDNDRISSSDLYYMAHRVASYPIGPADPLELCSDLGIAQWIAATCKRHGWIYVSDQGVWYRWAGGRWVNEGKRYRPTVLVEQAIDHLTNLINNARDTDPKLAKALEAFQDSLKSDSRISAVLNLARDLCAGSAVTASQFDRDPHLLNCPNGVVDLRTGRMYKHDPNYLLTHQTRVPYVPGAKSEVWEKFLRHISGGDESFVRYLQLVTGYCATGEVRAEKMWLLLGPPRSGKSTFIGAIHHVLGSYSYWVPSTMFASNAVEAAEAPSPALAGIRGKRLVISIELPANQAMRIPLVKTLTGGIGDEITARHLYQEFFTFKPICKIILAANEAPRVPSDDDAVWRRLVRVPFNRSLSEDEADPGIKERLLAGGEDSQAVLAWIIEGAVRWYSEGGRIREIPAIKDSTQELRLESNPLYEWVDARCELMLGDPSVWTPLHDLWVDYLDWCRDMHILRTVDIRWFSRYLMAFGAQPSRPIVDGRRVRGYKFIRLSAKYEPSSIDPDDDGQQAGGDPFAGAFEW